MNDNEFDTTNSSSKSYVDNKMSSLKNNISDIDILVKDIDIFLKNQYELFEVLSAKFPNIKQFSNALQDADDLSITVSNIKKKSSSCKDDLVSLEEVLEIRERQSKYNNEAKNVFTKLFLHIDDIVDNPSTLAELKKIISKIA